VHPPDPDLDVLPLLRAYLDLPWLTPFDPPVTAESAEDLEKAETTVRRELVSLLRPPLRAGLGPEPIYVDLDDEVRSRLVEWRLLAAEEGEEDRVLPWSRFLVFPRLTHRWLTAWRDDPGGLIMRFAVGDLAPPIDLDRAQMGSMSGGPFRPGIEVGADALRLGRWQGAHGVLDGHVDVRFLGEPGDMTFDLAVPWQVAFQSDEERWWPTSRPIEVVPVGGDEPRRWDQAPGGGERISVLEHWPALGFLRRQDDGSLRETERVGIEPPRDDEPEGPGPPATDVAGPLTDEAVEEAIAWHRANGQRFLGDLSDAEWRSLLAVLGVETDDAVWLTVDDDYTETRFLLSERTNPHSDERANGVRFWGHPGRTGGLGSIRMIGVHTTESDPTPTSAQGVARWQAFDAERPSSYHVLVDSATVVRTLEDESTAFHIRGLNTASLGLSFATRAATWGDHPDWEQAALRRGAWVAARWCATYDIPRRWLTRDEGEGDGRGFIRHSVADPDRRTDPGAAFPAEEFFRLVEEYLTDGGDGPQEGAPGAGRLEVSRAFVQRAASFQARQLDAVTVDGKVGTQTLRRLRLAPGAGEIGWNVADLQPGQTDPALVDALRGRDLAALVLRLATAGGTRRRTTDLRDDGAVEVGLSRVVDGLQITPGALLERLRRDHPELLEATFGGALAEDAPGLRSHLGLAPDGSGELLALATSEGYHPFVRLLGEDASAGAQLGLLREAVETAVGHALIQGPPRVATLGSVLLSCFHRDVEPTPGTIDGSPEGLYRAQREQVRSAAARGLPEHVDAVAAEFAARIFDHHVLPDVLTAWGSLAPWASLYEVSGTGGVAGRPPRPTWSDVWNDVAPAPLEQVDEPESVTTLNQAMIRLAPIWDEPWRSDLDITDLLAAPSGGRDWVDVDGDERMRYVMARLVEEYDYPVEGAAGIVGNLWAESGVLPNRIEGSAAATPMRARDFSGERVDFTPEQVMNRDRSAEQGPRLPGIGLAQWTAPGRRRGLFEHEYGGRRLGADILFDMDAQVDYLDHELRASYGRVHRLVTDEAVSVDDASDEILYSFETPGSIIEDGRRLPRSDERVQAVFRRRREPSRRALRTYRAGLP
jgi:hypothetical protein